MCQNTPYDNILSTNWSDVSGMGSKKVNTHLGYPQSKTNTGDG